MKFRSDAELPSTGGANNFIKLKEKESVEGVFRGELYEFFILWEANKSRIVPEGTVDSKFRFRINFVVKEGSVYVPKVFEQGIIVYKQLSALHDEYSLPETVVKITRNGTGTDTTYSLLPLLKKPLTKEALEFLNVMDLIPLEAKASDSGFERSGDVPFCGDVPF